MAEFEVFISGVTSEFGSIREQIAGQLEAITRQLNIPPFTIHEQKLFHQQFNARTTLKLIHDYIRDCSAVICLVGNRSGPKPPKISSDEFLTVLPDWWCNEGFSDASYTQWEFFFTKYYNKSYFVFNAVDGLAPEQSLSLEDFSDQQAAFQRYLFKHLGVYRTPFSSGADVCAQVRKIDWETIWFTDGWSLKTTFAPFIAKRREIFCGRSWIFKEVGAWHDAPSHSERLTLLTGTAGSGKSAFTTQFIETGQCGKVFAYHFFMHDNEKATTLDGFVRNIASMLGDRMPDYRQRLLKLREEREFLTKSAEDGPRRFFRSAIIELLASIPPPADADGRPVWIVLDALDELAEDREKKRLLFELLSWSLPLLPAWLRILATCRNNDFADQIVELHDTGRPLVHRIDIDEGRDKEGDEAFQNYIDRRLQSSSKQLGQDLKSIILERSERNFLYLSYVLDSYLNGDYDVEDLRKLPSGLSGVYLRNFRRLYPDADEEEFANGIKPVLATLLVSRQPLPRQWLSAITGLPSNRLGIMLARLKPYLSDRQLGISIFHKSLSDWLNDVEQSHDYAVDAVTGHRLIANFCAGILASGRGRVVDLGRQASRDDRNYLIHYGVHHFLASGRWSDAVDLIDFIAIKGGATSHGNSRRSDVALLRMTRSVMKGLQYCTKAEGRKIGPRKLVELMKNFYQVEPFSGPIKVLMRDHHDKWPNILHTLLDAGNYVLRFAISEEMARIIAGDADSTVVQIDQIYGYLRDQDVNLSELAAYTLRHLYGKSQYGVGVGGPVGLKNLELMGEAESWASRSALGDLLVNLTFQRRFDATRVRSPRFWNPIWEMNAIDIWDIKAATAFQNGEPPAGADQPTLETYENFQRVEALRQEVLARAQNEGIPGLIYLVEEFDSLGRNPDQLSEEPDFGRSKILLDLFRLLFCHPLWNVGEVAAAVLVSLAESDTRHQTIIAALLDDRHWCERFDQPASYWRITFGAIEAAYQLAGIDQMAMFGGAVLRFYDHPNCRVRALCAENLIAHIIDQPSDLREPLLEKFAGQICRWARDDDAWVLEHIFRLFKTLSSERLDCARFLGPDMPFLLDGLPRSDWSELPRGAFLSHIEQRQLSRQSPDITTSVSSS